MLRVILSRLRRPAALVPSAILAVGCAALLSQAQAQGGDSAARDLSVEQAAVHAVQAPDADAQSSLGVTAWVDRADNTYAVGEQVRLFVRASKDAWITVLNVGSSGRTTVLFPNEHQPETRVPANSIVEIPSRSSDARITVDGPTGRELIKVIATTSPTPLFAAVKTTRAGPFRALEADAQSLARDLQVTMDANANSEWDDYNMVIATVTSR